jgi:hypothetical protein
MDYNTRQQLDFDNYCQRAQRIRDEKMLQDRMALKATDALSAGLMLAATIGFFYYTFKITFWTVKGIIKLIWWLIHGFIRL